MAILDTVKNQIPTLSAEEAPARPSATLIKKLCPKCHGSMLEFYENDDYVDCFACDESISVRDLLRSSESNFGAADGGSASLAVVVDSPESGLIYLENFFANYDWEMYNQETGILIREIDDMVENNKIRQGASPVSWLLDFRSVSIPLRKRLEGLDALEAELVAGYSADNTGIMDLFDRYKNNVDALITNKPALLKRLQNDISFAERQGLDDANLQEMRAEAETLTAALEKVKEVQKLVDLPAVAEKQARIDKEMISAFKAKGIDVVAEYKNACMYFNQNTRDKRVALRTFESIRGYADSISYIEKINRYFNYYHKFFHFFDTDYVFKTHAGAVPVLDPTAKSEKKGCFSKKSKPLPLSEEDAYTGDTLELYEVVNGEPAAEPILKSITSIIKYYGSILYYVKLGRMVCAFDLATGNHVELLAAENASDLKVCADNQERYCYMGRAGKSIYIRKRLDVIIEKAGCKDKLFGKKDTVVERRNNYAVYELKLDDCTCNLMLDQVVDIIDRRDQYLFYTVAEELPHGEVETEETRRALKKLAIMAMNTATYEKEVIFKEDCDIRAISGTKIVYTRRAPNRFNLDLHVLDMVTKQDLTVEKNIYRFLAVINGKIFYYVGNKNYQPLFSNNYEGTDRVEIMTNVERVIGVIAGWIYVMKGYGRNALLVKISADGKQRLIICSQFRQSVKITDSHIYYVTSGNALRVVRSDGKENTLIAEDIDLNNVCVDKDCIYYLRSEWTGKRTNKSLYRMDMDGHNVSKLLFNVNSMKNYDDRTLYVEREDQIRFRILFPALHKKDERETVDTFDLTRYYRYDKETGEMKNILTVGMPHPSHYEAKGCLGKKTDLETVFTEIPIEDEFEEKGERAGTALFEQAAEGKVDEALKKANRPGCGRRQKK